MASLKNKDKRILETYLEMKGGYVCNFTNRTFAEFVADLVDIDIYAVKYQGEHSGSKANLLRMFWDIEDNTKVAKLLEGLIEYWKEETVTGLTGYQSFKPSLYEKCKEIVAQLRYEVVELHPNSSDKDFHILTKNLNENIRAGKVEQVMDHLHTFVVKYLRELCRKKGLKYEKGTALNSLIGGYIKYLRDNNHLETEMSLKIIKTSIEVLGSFDDIRNNRSFAHDNPLLNKEEASLILKYVSSLINFIGELEKKIDYKQKKTLNEYDGPSQEEIDAAGDAWIEMQIEIMRGR